MLNKVTELEKIGESITIGRDVFLMAQHKSIRGSLGQYAEKLSSLGQKRKQALAQSLDALFILIALSTANILRLETIDFQQLWPLFIVLPVATVLIFAKLGVYRMVIRFSGLDELASLAKGVVVSSLLLLIVQYLLAPNPNPRSIFIILPKWCRIQTCGLAG